MRIYFIWISLLILPNALVVSQPFAKQPGVREDADPEVQHGDPSDIHNEQVISVRITSSVAVGRGKAKSTKIPENEYIQNVNATLLPTIVTKINPTNPTTIEDIENETVTDAMPYIGANIDFIKQLQARKEARGVNHYEQVNPFETVKQFNYNISDDHTTESTSNTDSDIDSTASETEENIENIPIGRSISSLSAKTYVQSLTDDSLQERDRNTRLTTVSFNIVHDNPKINDNYNHASNTFGQSQQFYNPPAKVYSQPAQIYSQPAKFYSEPAKFYSEPSKIYSEPAKIYSEPAKIYSEPAKYYSQPASLHLTPEPLPNHTPWRPRSRTISPTSPTRNPDITTTPITTVTYKTNTERYIVEHQPEKNYEVDEKISVMTDGRSHGVQKPNNENCKQENCKVGYVVEGRQYKKYRVEERTPDGFIVGEYGVVRNEDGALRGVRYTADSEASPRLIQDALMKFLQLK
ncbi:PREDICTED: uncharacterized protein LOC106102022 [Papilio polytes]|uniref:uncharacterized protein LOC106102022 n=1 Tax=Papilio polytes TaxID=76194 RepID=UPI00067658C3|nr:PREDICTED: uncharacterized protein LOC106102022 [Papilio polytes]